VIFDHFLVVAAALVGRSSFDAKTYHFIDLQKTSILFCRLEHFPILLKELNVFDILLQSPK
jgi:hypothetical protein